MDRYGAFDVHAMSILPPPPPPRRFARWWCKLGFHSWGLSICSDCGKPDPILRASIDAQWALMTPEQQERYLRKAEDKLSSAFEDAEREGSTHEEG